MLSILNSQCEEQPQPVKLLKRYFQKHRSQNPKGGIKHFGFGAENCWNSLYFAKERERKKRKENVEFTRLNSSKNMRGKISFYLYHRFV